MLRLKLRLVSRLGFSRARFFFRRRFFNTALLTRLAFDMVKTNGSMKSRPSMWVGRPCPKFPKSDPFDVALGVALGAALRRFRPRVRGTAFDTSLMLGNPVCEHKVSPKCPRVVQNAPGGAH